MVASHDIAAHDVLAVLVPAVRIEAAVYLDVVFHHATESVAVLDSATQAEIVVNAVIGGAAVEVPVAAIPAPGVERSVVAGFLDGVEDVAELNHVAFPAAITEVDAGPPTCAPGRRSKTHRGTTPLPLRGRVARRAG